MVDSRFEEVICRFKDDYLFVRVFGKGKKNLVTFHGYGQDSGIFLPLSRQNEYKIYSFDLFYHGKSSHPEESCTLDHEVFEEFLQDFFRQTSLQNFDVMGFSMGGKYALSLVELFPKVVGKLFLIAPDGVSRNIWYRLATSSALTRGIFKYLITHPDSFFKVALFLERAGFIDGRVRKFAISQMETFKKRQKVFSSWIYLRNFFVPPKIFAQTVLINNIDVSVVIGKYDRIITRRSVKVLLDKIGWEKLQITNSGHSSILKNYLHQFVIERSGPST